MTLSSTKDEIVVTGYGLVSPLGSDPIGFYHSLLNNQSGISANDLFEGYGVPSVGGSVVSDYNPLDYLTRKEIRTHDKYLEFAIVASQNALKMANLLHDRSKYSSDEIGVSISTCVAGTDTQTSVQKKVVKNGLEHITPYYIPFSLASMCASTVSKKFSLHGPSVSIATACASSNSAIIDGINKLKNNQAKVMIVGGTESCLTSLCMAGFRSLGLLAKGDCKPSELLKPWDRNRNGIVLSEGSAVLILEKKQHAIERNATIYAYLKGYSENCDAHHTVFPQPDGKYLAQCISKSISNSGLCPSDIDYINPHATSTVAGDLAEMKAIKTVFGTAEVPISSTKSFIGHTLSAAAAIEAIVCIESLKQQRLHGTLNTAEVCPEISDLGIKPLLNSKRCKLKNILSISFGMGGHNSCIVFGGV
jgi:3-oxoacyl-[acyl-carrier-protein] synthase II